MARSFVDTNKLEAIVAPVCQAQGVELVDVRHLLEQGGAVLRVLIERPGAESMPKGVGGVSVDDCTRVSRALSAVLDDNETLIPGNYRLEVSSPGVERPLVKLRDFENYAGREARIVTSVPVVGERKNYSGTLVSVRGEHVVLRDEQGNDLDIPITEIAKAHLLFRF